MRSSPAPATRTFVHAFDGRKQPFLSPRCGLALAAAVLVLAGLAVYANTFSAPFIFDDGPSITANPTLHHFWTAFLPPHHDGETVAGRPVLNLSFALNYALSGNAVWSYHALNLVIHLLAGLLLFGLVRRTLLQPVLRGRFGDAALPLALNVALLWIVHPLQTESVTYVVQRAESLMGLFYLLTLYAFVRGATATAAGRRWYGVAFGACLLGMGTKEVMVTAPLLALLYDRTFVAGTFREAWRRRPRVYLALAATWVPLAVLVAAAGGRGGSAGFGTGISVWTYALTQCRAVPHYLRLVFWPHPLVLDYGMATVKNAAAVAPQALLLVLLVAGTLAALRWRPALGFLGCWFFVILAPSSSLVPVATQTMAEHRLYLSLAAVIALVVLGAYAWFGRRCLPVLLAPAIALGWTAARRNAVYHSGESIWRDTVAREPDNPRAHLSLGTALIREGRVPEAAQEFATAVRLEPDYIEALNNLGNVLCLTGRFDEAVTRYQQVLRLKPDYADTHYNLGNALLQLQRLPEAAAQYEAALRLAPADADTEYALANTLAQLGQFDAAIAHYEQALRLRPDFPAARHNLDLILPMGTSSSP